MLKGQFAAILNVKRWSSCDAVIRHISIRTNVAAWRTTCCIKRNDRVLLSCMHNVVYVVVIMPG
eukprot:7422264-Lingulodinium_polyedra.AAC.1